GMRRSKVIQVAENQIASVEAIDGRPLPKGRLLGDEVECNQFQDGEAFLANGGFKGPQVAIIRPGTYRINPFLFNVARRAATEVASGKVGGVAEVPPGFVAVLRSNIGEELDQADIQPVPVTDSPDFDQTIHAAVERLLVPDRNRRGIWRNPVAPGKYNLNRVAFTAYLVP